MLVPVVREVFASGQVVSEFGSPRTRQIAAASICDDGSYIANAGISPAPVCEMVKVRPAIVSVPVRAVVPLVATDTVALPLPVPLAPAVTVANEEAEVAVQAHPACVVTVTVDVPPGGPKLAVVGVIVYVQVAVGVVGVVVGGVVGVTGAGAAGDDSREQALTLVRTARSAILASARVAVTPKISQPSRQVVKLRSNSMRLT